MQGAMDMSTPVTRGELREELARHTRASYEDASTQISVIDEKYADLPGRVSRLETTVLAPKLR